MRENGRRLLLAAVWAKPSAQRKNPGSAGPSHSSLLTTLAHRPSQPSCAKAIMPA
jgi:hypothetical protein